jgi:aminopeptidase YwaD
MRKCENRYLKGKMVFCLLFFVSISYTQLSEGRRITKELCSSNYFGRGYVKSGDSLAAEFLATEFRKRGLKKIKKSYFQAFQFDVNTFPAEMSVFFNEKTLNPGVDYIVDPASGSSNVEWNYKYLDQNSLFHEGTMMELVREIRDKRSWNSLLIDTRQLKGDSLKKIKAFQEELAQFCHVMSITDEKFTFSVAHEQLAYSLIYVKGNVFSIDAKIRTSIDARLKKQHTARNVLALLPARKKTKKTILLTAHYDHLGGMGAQTYFPGGNDNASGTSILFAIADEVKKKKLNYNVAFIAFAGEEAGLLGSKYYTEHPLIPLKNIEFVLNLDIMGSGEDGITVVNATVFPELFEKLNAINEEKKYLTQIKKRGKAANSDHYWFSEKGIPAFFIYTMGPNKNYHDVFDTYENLSFNKYEDLVKLILDFLRKL